MREEVAWLVDRHCQTAGFAIAQGAEMEPPDALKMIEDWEASLAAVPEELEDPETYELKQALGLRD